MTYRSGEPQVERFRRRSELQLTPSHNGPRRGLESNGDLQDRIEGGLIVHVITKAAQPLRARGPQWSLRAAVHVQLLTIIDMGVLPTRGWFNGSQAMILQPLHPENLANWSAIHYAAG